MGACQLVEWQQAPELRDVAVPESGAGQLLIRVAGAGACHSDLHLMEWPEGTLPFGLPFTPGHKDAVGLRRAVRGPVGRPRLGRALGTGRPQRVAGPGVTQIGHAGRHYTTFRQNLDNGSSRKLGSWTGLVQVLAPSPIIQEHR